VSDQEFRATNDRLLGMPRHEGESGGCSGDSVIDCQTVRQLLYLCKDELSAELEAELTVHLDHCPGCACLAEPKRRIVIVLRQRCQCLRVSAPERLRVRILASLPHRQGSNV
jgi:hypothetical protein